MSWLDSLRFPLENDYQQLVYERQACWPLITSLMSVFEQFHRFPGFNKVSRLQEKIQQVNVQFNKVSQLRRHMTQGSWWREYCFAASDQRKKFMTLRARYAMSLRQLAKQFDQLRQQYFSYFLDRQKAGMNMEGFRQLIAIFPRGPLHDYYQAHYFLMLDEEDSNRRSITDKKIQRLLKQSLTGSYPHPYYLEQLYIRGLHYAAMSECNERHRESYMSSAKQCLWDAAQENYAPAMWTCAHYFSAEQLIPTSQGQFNARILLWAQAAQQNFIPAIADLSQQYIVDMQQQTLNPRLRTYQYLFTNLMSQDQFFQKISLAAYAHDSAQVRDMLGNLNVFLHNAEHAKVFPVLQLLKLQRNAEIWATRMQDQNYLEVKVTNNLVNPKVQLETVFDEALHLNQESTVMPSYRTYRSWHRFGPSESRMIDALVKSYSRIRHRSCFTERLLAVDFIRDMVKRWLTIEHKSMKEVRAVLNLKSYLEEECELLLRLPIVKLAQANYKPERVMNQRLSLLSIGDAPFA